MISTAKIGCLKLCQCVANAAAFVAVMFQSFDGVLHFNNMCFAFCADNMRMIQLNLLFGNFSFESQIIRIWYFAFYVFG